MPKRKLTKAEQIAQIPIEEIIKLSGEGGKKQQINYLMTLASGYKRRVQSFRRRGVFSYAQDKYETYHSTLDAKSIKKLSFNQRVLEIAKLQSFFQSTTSSLEGIRKVNKEQDSRIFGVDKRGNPNNTMSKETRKAFWRIYDAFLNKNPTEFLASDQVQMILSDFEIPQNLVDQIWNNEDTENLDPAFMQILTDLKKAVQSARDIENLFDS